MWCTCLRYVSAPCTCSYTGKLAHRRLKVQVDWDNSEFHLSFWKLPKPLPHSRQKISLIFHPKKSEFRLQLRHHGSANLTEMSNCSWNMVIWVNIRIRHALSISPSVAVPPETCTQMEVHVLPTVIAHRLRKTRSTWNKCRFLTIEIFQSLDTASGWYSAVERVVRFQ